MKSSSYIISSCLLFLASTFLVCFSGINFYIKLILNLIVFAVYFIVTRKLIQGKFKQYTDRIKKLKRDLKKFNFEVQVTSSQISSVSENISVTLDENNEFAKYVYDEVKEMSNKNEHVYNSITNTLSEVKNIVDLLNNAKDITSQMIKKSSISKDTVRLSLEEIMQIVKTIDSIHESSNKTLANMERLQKTSGEIEHILETVSSISKQTQLLALNATIESARAGEHGKGFAVVAAEIHKLADNTGKSVEEIGALIKSIHGEVGSVYTVVRENASRVDEGISATKSIEKYLEKIDSSFNDVFGMMDKINSLSQQEVLIAQNVGNQIRDVEDVLSATLRSVDDVCESVHQQKKNIEEISSMGIRLNEASSTLSELFSGEAEDVEALSNDAMDKAKNSLSIIHEELCSKSEIINSKDSAIHEEILRDFKDKYPFVEAVWTNDKKGRFICSLPKAGIANANVREWFKRSIKGENFVSSIYISAITRNPCITVSSPIMSNTGEIVGVVGIDINIH
ncbi:methyl-accepting chemotaxis protein [Ruminiclostridium josui]|uniref:methyl-accepting chemotaxis protein n=2 Tax=Ruminiclostridium josui TaxID=1499 RepID=UPI00046613B1|nr:methyl-accepting chemotaxis protein [Ruminiclostridium josui]